MKTLLTLIAAILIGCSSHVYAASNTFLDYQNYNHGYCPDCNCCPCKCAGGGCYAPDNPNSPQDPVNPQGSCQKPDPCCPPATSVCTQCGLNVIYVGAGIAIIATVASIIVGSNNGHVYSHSS